MIKYLALFILSFEVLSAQKILIIGDSHLYSPMGRALYNGLVEKGFKVKVAGNCGAVVETWFESKPVKYCYWQKGWDLKELKIPWTPDEGGKTFIPPKLTTLLPEADTIVISIVANYAYDKDKKRAVEKMRELAGKIQSLGKKCVWISTPARNHSKTQSDSNLDSWVKEAVEDKCKTIYPAKSMTYPKGKSDGIHYWPTSVNDAFSKQISIWKDTVSKHF